MDQGVMRGLSLLPKEVKHFPAELVEPYFGVGKRPFDPKFMVLAYQLTAMTCPNLEDNQCKAYDVRPASCRQYPFSLDPDHDGGTLLGVDMNCPAVNESTGTLEFPDRESAEKLLELKRLAAENPRRAWIYDLDSEKWIRYDKLG
jgi:Fe-S-cluster containining protein